MFCVVSNCFERLNVVEVLNIVERSLVDVYYILSIICLCVFGENVVIPRSAKCFEVLTFRRLFQLISGNI